MLYGQPEYDKKILELITDQKDDYKHVCYNAACSHADDMAVHLYGKNPVKILNRVRPREDPETKEYRIQSYETITKSAADKALSIVGKIFNPSLYSIRENEGNDQAKKLYEYCMSDYQYNHSIVNYVSEVGLRKMMADPNGIFVVKPNKNPQNDLEMVEPIIKIYGSANVWYFDDDAYTIYLNKSKRGDITLYNFEYYDATSIINFSAYTPNQQQIVITETDRYDHNFGEIPVWNLKGNTEVQDDGTEIQKSFFDPATPFWNKAINHESDLDGAYINHMHPIRVELAEECDFVSGNRQRCNMGMLIDPNSGEKSTCPSCNGTGYKSVKSPFGVYRVDHEKLNGDKSGVQPVSFVTVPVDATKMLEQRIESLLEKGLYALNMDIVNKIGENQSGKAKVIDRGELYDFLYKISSVVFDTHIRNIFYYFDKYMFGVVNLNPGSEEDKSNLPMINKPVMFDITTAVEMVNEYKASKDAGLNPHYLRIKQMQLNAKEFASDDDLKCFLNLVLECDPLPEIPDDTILANNLEGMYRKYDPIIHFNIGTFVKRALQEYPEKTEGTGFEYMDYNQRYEILVKYAKEIEAENRDTLVPSNLNSGQVDANGNPIDIKKSLDNAIITKVDRTAFK